MTAEKPVAYILHGDDRVAIDHFISTLVGRMGDPGMAELNVTRLEGLLASDEEIRTAALALPFLADRRLVILHNPMARLTSPAARDRLVRLLDSLPETTALLLVIQDHLHYRGWDVLKEGHWLLKWAADAGSRALVRQFPLPDGREMPAWISRQAQAAGGKFTSEAALALADHIGSDTALAAQEINKLLTYVDGQRAVELADVELLVVSGGPVNVFTMVEALADRNARQAARLLHSLLIETDSSNLFGLVVRQFRFLVKVKEILEEGGDQSQVVRELKNPPYARQYIAQARRFSQSELDAIYHRLLELDEAMKTSQIPEDLALELLVAEIAR